MMWSLIQIVRCCCHLAISSIKNHPNISLSFELPFVVYSLHKNCKLIRHWVSRSCNCCFVRVVIVLTCSSSSSHVTEILRRQLLLWQNVLLEIIGDYCGYKEYVRKIFAATQEYLCWILSDYSFHSPITGQYITLTCCTSFLSLFIFLFKLQ